MAKQIKTHLLHREKLANLIVFLNFITSRHLDTIYATDSSYKKIMSLPSFLDMLDNERAGQRTVRRQLTSTLFFSSSVKCNFTFGMSNKCVNPKTTWAFLFPIHMYKMSIQKPLIVCIIHVLVLVHRKPPVISFLYFPLFL